MDWVMVWHACSIPLLWDDDPTRVVRVYYPFQVFIIDWLLIFVNQTQVGADLRYLLLQRVTYELSVDPVVSLQNIQKKKKKKKKIYSIKVVIIPPDNSYLFS